MNHASAKSSFSSVARLYFSCASSQKAFFSSGEAAASARSERRTPQLHNTLGFRIASEIFSRLRIPSSCNCFFSTVFLEDSRARLPHASASPKRPFLFRGESSRMVFQKVYAFSHSLFFWARIAFPQSTSIPLPDLTAS